MDTVLFKIRWFFCICATLTAVAGYNRNGQVNGFFQSDYHCRLATISQNSMPAGAIEVKNVKYLGPCAFKTEVGQYVSRCCELGPKECQYIWIFKNYCYSVSCDVGSHVCDPKEFPKSPMSESSVYLKIDYGLVPLISNKHLPNGNEIGDYVLPVSKPVSNKPKENHRIPTSADTPPVAKAGPDVILQFPLDRVTLHGDESYDDKGISYYLWKLTSPSGLNPPTLIDRTLPNLHVINLIPGDYNFTLMVSDELRQMSRDTVQVHVLPGPSSPPLEEPKNSEVNYSGESKPPEISNPPSDSGEPESLANSSTLGESATNNRSDVIAEGRDTEFYSRKRNLFKVMIPVLLCVGIILILSALLVGVGVCLFRNKRHMKHLYRYKRLPETIEKT